MTQLATPLRSEQRRHRHRPCRERQHAGWSRTPARLQTLLSLCATVQVSLALRSRSSLSAAAEFSPQPGLCYVPVPFDGPLRHVQHFGCFFHTETAEESQLYDLALLWINCGQSGQRLVKSDKVQILPR